MFTNERKKEIKYIYIQLMDNDKSMMDIEKFKEFVGIFNITDPNFIFDYNCLEYPYINDIIDVLVSHFRSFTIRCDKRKHIDIYENTIHNMINEFHVKIDTSLSYDKISRRINDNTQLFNYCKDLDKTNIFKFIIDLYVDKNNITYLKETLKILTESGFKSKIFFDEYPLNGYYKSKKEKKYCIDNSLETFLIFDNILKDKDILIENKENILFHLSNLMTLKCWNNADNFQLCITPNFKLKLCNKIDYELEFNPFDCFDGEYLKDDIYQKMRNEFIKYCLGCNCEDFFNERLY
jgi:hypothetical protein